MEVRQQLIQIGIMMLMGFLGIRLRLLRESSLDALAAYAMKIAMPCVLIYKLPMVSSRETVLSSVRVFVFAFFMYGVMLLAGWACGKLCRYSGDRLRVHMVQTGIGNMAIIGFPMIAAALGDAATIYVAIIFLVDQIYLYLVAYPLSFPAESGVRMNLAMLRRMLSPMVIALLAAVAMIFLNLRLPEDSIITAAIVNVANSSQPVSIVFVGGIVAGLRLGRNAGLPGAAMTVVVRMLVMPIVVFLAADALGFAVMESKTLALTVALPSLISMAIMSRANGSDCEYATVNTCVTTVCCLGTLPVVIGVLNRLA
ncbi:AEC family transporter [Dysosmobacter sp.]|uniref:AEC family transporter n=1 Tax=Dysosmobacter sp. TaxID=2591382 RepID=UPI002A8A05CF|nr:AEC family transporter [Dysosmobacter sp.]MDY3281376.1 AEC family transporter [Dysosmobacter sp.]